MNIDFKKLVKPYKDESISNLQKWIRIDSVYDKSTSSEEKPFGQGVYDALEFIAQLAEKEGFNVDRCDNYCTEISFGEGELIAIYAHADVVPVTGKWNYDPFGAEIVDEIMYGRGTSDDKGPALAAFYALKALKENNLIDGYKVSLVIGGNEESGSQCLEHYFHKLNKPYPKYGFTPDGDFPLIYGEKGITGYIHTLETELPNVISIKGGVAVNSVIDEVNCVLKHDYKLSKACEKFFSLVNIRYQYLPGTDYDELVVYGKSSHGSLPQLGVNAALHLLRFLGWFYNDLDISEIANWYLEPTGKMFNCHYHGEYLLDTTYNVGLVNFEQNKLTLVINFRYPENCDPRIVEQTMNELGLGQVKFFGYGEPLLVDPNSEMIKTLYKIYQEETGDYQTPIMTIGGGTYARESKNTIAFGSHFPGREDNIHSPNEKIHLDDYLSSQSIYARAIYELGKLK